MKKLYFALLVFLSVCTANSAFGQSISINYFDSAAKYAPGSGVAVQLNLSGKFALTASGIPDNQFILQLSDQFGNFTVAATKSLTYINNFYTPNITGVIPASIPSGMGYRLRVKSTNPERVSDPSAPFEIIGTAQEIVPKFSFSSETLKLDCFNNNYFGFVDKSNSDTTRELNAEILDYDLNSEYSIKLIKRYPSLQIQSLTHFFGAFNIPSGLPVGNYVIEIKKTSSSGITSINSYNYLFNTGNTSLGNTSSENICTTNDFNINIDTNNIKTNYPGSYYTFDFGDGSALRYVTHEELMKNPNFTHQYLIATCDAPTSLNANGFYKVTAKLYNQGIGSGLSPNSNLCTTFSLNGNGTTKNVKVSTQPIANFTGPTSVCFKSPATFTNTTQAGKWANTSGVCLTTTTVKWTWKSPGQNQFTAVPSAFISITNKDLIIPANALSIIGVWYIRLEANNPEGCIDATEKIMPLCVEAAPLPSFNFVYGEQVIANNSTLCINTTPAPTVILKNKSNTLVPPSPCSSATYLWTITPSTGATISNPTAVDPTLTFSIAGTYNVRLRVTNSCGAVDTTKTITVVGPPSISNYSGSVSYCDTIPKQIDFAPTYFANYAKTADLTYSWTVTGTGIDITDYEYTGGTTASSANPKIIFKKYGTYAVKVVFTNGCGSAEATKTFIFNQPLQASITANTSATAITVCPNTPINLNALINGPPGYTVKWTQSLNAGGSLSSITDTNTVYTPVAADNGKKLTFTLTVSYPGFPPTNAPSPCANTVVKTIDVTYEANNTAANIFKTICTGASANVPLSSSITGSQFIWRVKSRGSISGAIDNSTYAAGPINDVLINSGTTIQTVVYEVTARGPSGCTGTPFDVEVTVLPEITGNQIGLDQSICVNQVPDTLRQKTGITLAGGRGPGNYIYLWEEKTASGTWIPATGTNNLVYYVPPALSASMQYRRNVYSPNNAGCIDTSLPVTITVNPLPSITLGTVPEVCNTATQFAINYSNPQNSPQTYTITPNAAARAQGFTIITNAGLTASPILVAMPTSVAQGIYTFSITVKNANGCISNSQNFTLSVKEPPTTATAGADQILCTTSTFALSGNSPVIGTGLWTIQGPANGAVITSPSSFNSTVSGLGLGKSVTLRWTISNGACEPSFDEVVLTNSDSIKVAASAGADQRNCGYGTFNLSANAPAANETGLWSLVSGTATLPADLTNPTITVSGVLPGTTAVLKWTLSNLGCTSSSNIKLTNLSPIGNNTISPPAGIPCEGQSVNVTGSLPTNGSGGSTTAVYAYKWQIKYATGGWSDLSSSLQSLAQTLTSSASIRRIVTSFECSDTSNVVDITVYPKLVNTISGSQVICYNTAPSILTGIQPTGGDGSNYTYVWEKSTTSATSGFSPIASTNTKDYAPGALTTTTYFRRVVTSGSTCTSVSNVVTVTVNPKPVMTGLSNKVYCNNSTVSPISFTSSTGSTTYRWTNSNTAIDLVASGTGTIPSFTSANTSKVPIEAIISVTPVYNSFDAVNNLFVNCDGDPADFKIIILPTISIPPNSIADKTLCTGSSVAKFRPATDAGTLPTDAKVRFKWTVSGSGTSLTNSPTSSPLRDSIDAFTTLNNTTANLETIITVTPVYEYLGILCDGIPFRYKVIVVPGPTTPNAGNDKPLCNVTEYILEGNSLAVGVGTWSLVSGPPVSFVDPNLYNTKVTGLLAGTRYEFKWTTTNLPCSASPSDNVIIDILSPITNKIKVDRNVICRDESVNFSTDVLSGGDISGGGLNASYAYVWQTSEDGNTWTTVSGQTGVNFNFTPPTTLSKIYVRRGVSSYNLCFIYSEPIEITVNPKTPPADAKDDQILCNLSSTTLKADNNLGSTFAGRGIWTDVTPGGSTPALTFSNANDPGAVVSGLQPDKTYTLRWTIAGLAPCLPTSDEVTITVRPALTTPDAGPDDKLCDRTSANNSYPLSGNILRSFETGTWTIVQQPVGSTATFSNNRLPTATVTGLIAGEYKFRWTITNDAGCTAVNDEVTLQVYEQPQPGTLTTSIAGVCYNGNGTLTLSGATGTIAQWESSIDNGVTWAPIVYTAATYNFTELKQTTIFRVKVSSDGASTGCPSFVYSNSVTITVDPASVGGDTAGADTVCQDSNSGTITLSGKVGTVIRWEKSTDGITWTAISSSLTSQTSQTYLNLTQTTQYRAVVRSGVCNEVYSTITTITVNPKTPQADAKQDEILCNLSSTTLKAENNLGTNFSGTWTITSQPVGSTATFSDATSPSSTILGLIPGNYVLKWTIFGKAPCIDTHDEVTITVDPASVGGDTAGADTVCQGSNSGTITLSGHVGTVQGWEYSTNNGTSWTAIIPDNTTATLSYTGLTTLPNTITQYQYRARVKSGVCSEVYSSITTITVLPPVTKAEVENRSECNITTSQLIAKPASQGIGTWTQLPGGPNVAVISDIHNPTSVVSNLVVGVYTFKWTIDNGYCAPSSDTMTLTNYPAIVNEIQTAVDTICADQAILISDKTHTGGTGTYAYKWQSSPNGTTWNDISPAQTSLTLSMNLSTSTYFRRIISSVPCSSVSDSIYIFVQPALANNTITAISEVCINKPVALIVGSNPTGGDGVFSYQWQSKVGAGAWTNISGATGKDYQPLPLLQTTSFRRILTTALCNGPQQSVSVANEIIVRLNAKAEFSASKLVNCSPFNLRSVITLTPYPDLNSTYKWYADGVLIGTGTTFPAYTIANDGVTVDIKLVTLSKFGCDSAEKVISFQTIKHVTAAFTKSVALGCGPLTVSFTNTSTPAGPGPQYQWNFGNGQTSTLANPPAITFQPHLLNRDTTYVIRLRAYTDCQESIFIDSVLVRPKPVSIFSPDKTEGCAPVVVNFTNQSKGHPATYKFIFGDGDTYTTTTLETVQHIYQDVLVNTLYTAKLIVTNECGVDSSSYVIKVKPNTVVANLVVNGPEKQGCPPHTVTFFNNSTGANQFIWNFGDGTPIITNAARTMVHTFVAGGTYQVKLTATNGCSVRETTETIVVYPEPISSYTTAKNTYCKDEWINFVNTSPQGDFVWTFGDGVSSTQTNPQHRFVTPGTYLVTLTTFVTQPDGTRCSKSVSKSFTVLNPPIATFSSNASAFNCAPFQLMVSNTSQFANKYSWYVDGVLVSTQATPLNLWLYASNRAVTVRLVAENTAGCASASVEQTIQMYPRPEANFVVLPSQIIKIPNYTFSFQNTTLGAVTSYKWTFGDGSTSTATNPTHTYKMIGQYQVNLIAFNQEGCSDTLSRQVEVQTVPGYLFVPNAFEPGSQTYELKTFKPKGSGIERYHLKIFNKWGYLVWETTAIDSNGSPVEGWDGMMNGVPAPPDVYVWTIDAKFINQTVWPGMRYKSSDKPKTVGSIHLIK